MILGCQLRSGCFPRVHLIFVYEIVEWTNFIFLLANDAKIWAAFAAAGHQAQIKTKWATVNFQRIRQQLRAVQLMLSLSSATSSFNFVNSCSSWEPIMSPQDPHQVVLRLHMDGDGRGGMKSGKEKICQKTMCSLSTTTVQYCAEQL